MERNGRTVLVAGTSRARVLLQAPLGRPGTPAGTAALVSFLCSEDGGR